FSCLVANRYCGTDVMEQDESPPSAARRNAAFGIKRRRKGANPKRRQSFLKKKPNEAKPRHKILVER
ncbi:40801_t:CDS:1, partial [Gigaspora margarita]